MGISADMKFNFLFQNLEKVVTQKCFMSLALKAGVTSTLGYRINVHVRLYIRGKFLGQNCRFYWENVKRFEIFSCNQVFHCLMRSLTPFLDPVRLFHPVRLFGALE